ncbi:MAG: Hpt domain-containing protein [Bacteroidota bacterium]|nr:Hpt domain-containing protein [Bacteroidota bacterium]
MEYILRGEDIVVNMSFLEELAGDDPATIRILIETFIATVPASVQQLKEAFEQHDWNTLRQKAHSLKSSLSVIKVDNLQEHCNVIETTASADNTEKIHLLITEINEKAKKGTGLLLQLLQQLE